MLTHTELDRPMRRHVSSFSNFFGTLAKCTNYTSNFPGCSRSLPACPEWRAQNSPLEPACPEGAHRIQRAGPLSITKPQRDSPRCCRSAAPPQALGDSSAFRRVQPGTAADRAGTSRKHVAAVRNGTVGFSPSRSPEQTPSWEGRAGTEHHDITGPMCKTRTQMGEDTGTRRDPGNPPGPN